MSGSGDVSAQGGGHESWSVRLRREACDVLHCCLRGEKRNAIINGVCSGEQCCEHETGAQLGSDDAWCITHRLPLVLHRECTHGNSLPCKNLHPRELPASQD